MMTSTNATQMNEIDAINIIKRSMKYNRMRINKLMANRYTASLAVWNAMDNIYDYTDDKTDCAAIMGCDMVLFHLETTTYSNDNPEGQARHAKDLDIIERTDGPSKKIMRMIRKSRTLDEYCEATGWTHIRANTPSSRYFMYRKMIKDCALIWNTVHIRPDLLTYDYARIKQERAWIADGLVQHFYQPRFIERWLLEGNELEDYSSCM